jgi:ribosomal protein S18 acetylase RimI-like enzyme
VSAASDPRPRRASPEDYEAVAALVAEADELHARLMPDYFRRPQKPFRGRSEYQRLLSALDEAVYVIDLEGAPVAMVHVQLYDTPPGHSLVPRRRAHIDNLVVTARSRRQGLGSALVDAAGAWAKAKGAEELLLTVWAGNEPAERFYERLGFGRVSTVLGRAL